MSKYLCDSPTAKKLNPNPRNIYLDSASGVRLLCSNRARISQHNRQSKHFTRAELGLQFCWYYSPFLHVHNADHGTYPLLCSTASEVFNTKV